MTFALILFYLFSAVLVVSALVVVSTKNMVHSVMFLILAFLNASALFILLGAEFLAMMLIVVYVGAIAVLFLFVVMMLNIDFPSIKRAANRHLPLLTMVGVVMLCEILIIVKFSEVRSYQTNVLYEIPKDAHNINAIGQVLYTDFVLPFEISGAILFVAMIGAIMLTLKGETRFIRKQNISTQVSRTKQNSLKIVEVKSGEGINL
jgi:NADH-quinone oxidoreductase subunit J